MFDKSKFEWVGKAKNCGVNKGTDVRISVTKTKKDDRLAATFAFYGGCSKLITETEYIVVAEVKNRIFFDSADATKGIKVGENKACREDVRYAKFYGDEFCARLIPFEGEYELKYDEFYELYYVEMEKGE